MTERPESDFIDPPNFEAFHECSEQWQWELFRDMRKQRDAAIGLMKEPYRLEYGWKGDGTGYGYFLDGALVGDTLLDALRKEAAI